MQAYPTHEYLNSLPFHEDSVLRFEKEFEIICFKSFPDIVAFAKI
jgi:hypothetical protein